MNPGSRNWECGDNPSLNITNIIYPTYLKLKFIYSFTDCKINLTHIYCNICIIICIMAIMTYNVKSFKF